MIGLTLVFVINRVGRLIVKRKGMGKASAAASAAVDVLPEFKRASEPGCQA